MASLLSSSLVYALVCMGVVFSLGSLLVSNLTERLNKFLKQRSNMLYDAIYTMFNDKVNVNFGKLLYSHPAVESMKQDRFSMPQYIQDKTFSGVVVDVIADYALVYKKNEDTGTIEENTAANTEHIFRRFSDGAHKMAPTPLRSMIVNMVQKSALQSTDADRLSTLESLLRDWYNGYMDRLSGWYKQRISRRLFIVSLLVVMVINLNAFTLFHHFQNTAAPEANTEVTALPLGWHSHQLPVSIFSRYQNPGQDGIVYPPMKKHLSDYFYDAFRYVAGILISAVAISLGAPFWFDLLSKIVNVRRAGIKPKPTPNNN